MAESSSTFRAIAEKGEGVLVRHPSGVWTYPDAPMDTSGTNLRLPQEYVSDAEVQKALAEGHLLGVTNDPGSGLRSVRLKAGKGDEAIVMSVAAAGTAEAGTELPPNSRPSMDAGAKVMTAEEAAAAAERSMASLRPVGAVEGGEARKAPSDSETAADADAHRTGRRKS